MEYTFGRLGGIPMNEVLISILIPFAGTTLGAACVFFMRQDMNRMVQHSLLGFAGGVMTAASVWSLIIPAMEQSAAMGKWSFLPAFVGVWLGMMFLLILDKIIPHLHVNSEEQEGPAIRLPKSAMMVFAVILHNIPEGMAVGVAFGALAVGQTAEAVGAVMLAIGIGIQNFPEGMCVAFPLRSNGISKAKSFFIGQLSGAVEIVAGVIGALAVTAVSGILPWALSFSAGAMVAVVCSELIPESFSQGKVRATVGVIFGFAIMMILDLAFG